MIEKKIKIFGLLIWLVICVAVIYIADIYTHDKMEQVINKNLLNQAQSIQQKTQILISKKKESLIPLALTIAENQNLKNALLQNNINLLKLNDFITILKNHSRYQNVWFQVIDKNGNSFYRSWIEKKGDNVLNARIDVAQMIQNPQSTSSISTGKFDMTFKAMVPIFDNNIFIGIIEIITHFNSIAKELSESGIEAIFVVDKIYKNQLTQAFTKIFIDDYYIANYNVNKKLLEQIKSDGITKYLNTNSSYLYNENKHQLITTIDIPDLHGNPMGYGILFKNLDKKSSAKQNDQLNLHRDNLGYVILVLIIISILGYVIINTQYSNKLKANLEQIKIEKEKISTIINSQPSIIIITDDHYIQEANLKFFEFFDQYNTIAEFRKDHDSIAEFFDDTINDSDYITSKKGWLQTILNKEDKILKVAIMKNGDLRHFIVEANQQVLSNHTKLNIVSFFDITEQLKKDIIMFKQSKDAAMGEMIDVIAHQWKNPLGVIRLLGQEIAMESQEGNPNHKQIIEDSEKIELYVEHLLETMEEFRSFFRPNAKSFDISYKEIFESIKVLMKDDLIKNNISLEDPIGDMNIQIHVIPNEFKHVLLNLITNARDAFNENKISNRKIITKIVQNDDEVILTLCDNAGGIPQEVIDKIFEANFTTKAIGKGTGIGLYITQQILHKIGATIKVINKDSGACFEIRIPKQSPQVFI